MFEVIVRRFNSKMDSNHAQLRRFRHDLTPHRSTSDLLPKCRSEAQRARQAAARSKLNLIARQLYDLKYDHEWEQRQLQMLQQRGDSLEKEVCAGMGRVKEAECIVSEIEDLKLTLGGVGKDGGLGSERSTQPEAE
jgi:predicted RNase H-like nuclease (RuvC/YqgF family)